MKTLLQLGCLFEVPADAVRVHEGQAGLLAHLLVGTTPSKVYDLVAINNNDDDDDDNPDHNDDNNSYAAPIELESFQ
eukprot:3125044-Amphidinium_carterae.1